MADVDWRFERIDVTASVHFQADFQPVDVPVREAPPTGVQVRDGAPSWGGVVDEGVAASGADILLDDKGLFRAGGFQRGSALRHLSVEGEVGAYRVAIGDDGVLGARFDAFLKTHPQQVLAEIVLDFQNGMDVEREMTAEFKQKVAAREAVRAAGRAQSAGGKASTRVPLPKHNKKIGGFVTFLATTVMAYLASGAVECVGLFDDVVGTGVEPFCYGSCTVGVGKPRACYYPKDLNEGTNDCSIVLGGLNVVRDYCMASVASDGVAVGKLLDEQSGYVVQT